MPGGAFHRRVLELARDEEAPARSRWSEAFLALEILQTFAFTTVGMLLAWAALPGLLPGWESAAIVSGSMAPAVEVGDVVVFRPAEPEDLGPDAVIRFRPAQGGETITHRIVDIDAAGNITTRGDANEGADADTVSVTDVEGLGVLVVPLVGFPLVWADQGRVLPLLELALALALMSAPAVLRSRAAPDEPTERTAPRAAGPLIGGRLPLGAATSR